MSAPFKRILLLDFESRYSSKPTDWCPDAYTLRKMTTEEYIRSPLFKAFGVSMRWFEPDAPKTQWYSHAELPRIFSTIQWDKTAVVAHNAQFDVSILSWVYNLQPAFIFDTLSMARALRGPRGKNSLDALAKDFGLEAKGTEIGLTDGVYNPSAEILHKLGGYCDHDVYLLGEVFKRLLMMRSKDELGRDFDVAYDMAEWLYPKGELQLIDLTLRMYTRPLLELDQSMLENALEEERSTRESLLNRLKITDSDLASNDKFAEILKGIGIDPPTKKKKPTAKTPNPVGFNYAFAKTDAQFQAMLEGDNEVVASLCEARLKVKSTTERTRAQRFLDISQRGTLPVPLHYYGAASGRWAAAKGSAINMQNLKRGSFLRKAIMAPEGYVVVVADLSQIEPRVLAWLADYDDMLDVFRSGGDPYASFGAQMFNIPGLSKESHPDMRQSAKSALLGCFGADTPVLTKRGWVNIVDVQRNDLLWDGTEWVTHEGVLEQGKKEVLTARGISATSDHEILTERGWAEWHEVLKNPDLFRSALSLGNSPAFAGTAATSTRSTRGTQSNLGCAALADGRVTSTAQTCGTDVQHGATRALKQRRTLRDFAKKGWLKSAPTLRTATACWIASAPSLFGAPTPQVKRTQTMVGAVSKYIRRGLKTVQSFCATLLGSMGGTAPNYSLIGATTNGATSRETYASSRVRSIWPTSGASPCAKSSNSSSASPYSKQKMQTYDIAMAGPRNRYTILTDAGPIIVHNCGYQLGWAAFAAQLLVGFLGAPPVRYDKEFAKKLGVNAQYVQDFLAYRDGENIEKMMEIAHVCTTEELLVHCVAAKKIIDIYRATAYPVKGFWELCEGLIESALYEGHEYDHKGALLFRKEEIVLPNGMSLLYPNLRRERDEEKRLQWVYGENEKLYAGRVTNNVTQGLARVVMGDGMRRIAKRIPLVGTVHDEALGLVREAEGKAALGWMIRRMTEEPKYMPGIPLAADGGVHRRYGLAKN